MTVRPYSSRHYDSSHYNYTAPTKTIQHNNTEHKLQVYNTKTPWHYDCVTAPQLYGSTALQNQTPLYQTATDYTTLTVQHYVCNMS